MCAASGVLSLDDDVAIRGLDGVKGVNRLDLPTQAEDAEIPLPQLRFEIDGEWEIQ